ncbi:MAG: chemotaxis protein CheR [Planctomycetes bacterium]|nr:chemotaxis protein CheR [Planctomycetota bacterium]MCB9868722.1 chemotaxis protein CheR [Planctomycetota bacterium]MCB9889894.1 chemotaxis protein CheR [Planctomycetota bacterium]
MDAKVFERIRKLVYDESGIRIQEGKETMVAARLAQRLRVLRLPDEVAYLEYLMGESKQELVELLDVISTNVTSFFREAQHFDYLGRFLEEQARAGQRRIRLWCAASSTGEEPYTITICAREAFERARSSVDWRLLATDISTRVLAKAEAAVYEASKLEGLQESIRRRWFEPIRGSEPEAWQVKDELRQHAVFRRLNLAKPPFPMRGPLDAILCRNVMIYFDDGMRDRLVGEFHRLLRPNGLLITGLSESLLRIEGRFERAGPSIYRRIG